ncbi:glycosyltransferase family 39 protein [Streptomyces albidoflavus]
MPLLGTLALRLHADVGALRAVTLLLALAMLTVTYLVAARWTTPRRAALTALLVRCGLGFLRRLPEFLNDIGSTGLLLAVVYLLTRAQEHPGSRALLALPPFVLAAFYLRYGVAGNLAAIVLAALLAYGPRAWLARGRHLAVAGAVILAGLVPHFVHATRVTGSPLGLVFWATLAGRAAVRRGRAPLLPGDLPVPPRRGPRRCGDGGRAPRGVRGGAAATTDGRGRAPS